MIRPSRPVPDTLPKSMPFSLAIFCAAGLTSPAELPVPDELLALEEEEELLAEDEAEAEPEELADADEDAAPSVS